MKCFSRRVFFSVVALAGAFVAARVNAAPATAPVANAKGFYHPGVLVNHAQLDFIKNKIAAGAEPWKSAFEQAKASNLGALSYVARPRETCECGPRSNP